MAELMYKVGDVVNHWTGLSTDVKPTTGAVGSTFYEEDTTTQYVYGTSGWVMDNRPLQGS